MEPNFSGSPHTQPPSGFSNGIAAIAELHRAYCELIGEEIPLTMDREYAWSVFRSRGYGADELRLVVFEVRRAIDRQERKPGALKFRNLIVNIDWFDEDLAEARANLRNRRPPPSAKERVLEQSGRPAGVRTGTARTVETVVSNVANAPELTEAGKKALEEFRNLKANI